MFSTSQTVYWNWFGARSIKKASWHSMNTLLTLFISLFRRSLFVLSRYRYASLLNIAFLWVTYYIDRRDELFSGYYQMKLLSQTRPNLECIEPLSNMHAWTFFSSFTCFFTFFLSLNSPECFLLALWSMKIGNVCMEISAIKFSHFYYVVVVLLHICIHTCLTIDKMSQSICYFFQNNTWLAISKARCAAVKKTRERRLMCLWNV